jgi:hypothetical protein
MIQAPPGTKITTGFGLSIFSGKYKSSLSTITPNHICTSVASQRKIQSYKDMTCETKE